MYVEQYMYTESAYMHSQTIALKNVYSLPIIPAITHPKVRNLGFNYQAKCNVIIQNKMAVQWTKI